jgi:hypothetical protein
MAFGFDAFGGQPWWLQGQPAGAESVIAGQDVSVGLELGYGNAPDARFYQSLAMVRNRIAAGLALGAARSIAENQAFEKIRAFLPQLGAAIQPDPRAQIAQVAPGSPLGLPGLDGWFKANSGANAITHGIGGPAVAVPLPATYVASQSTSDAALWAETDPAVAPGSSSPAWLQRLEAWASSKQGTIALVGLGLAIVAAAAAASSSARKEAR